MLMSTDEFTDENEPWIDALAEQDEEDWTNYLLETCSKEFSKLGEKGCNQEKLLELLWDVMIWEETYSWALKTRHLASGSPPHTAPLPRTPRSKILGLAFSWPLTPSATTLASKTCCDG